MPDRNERATYEVQESNVDFNMTREETKERLQIGIEEEITKVPFEQCHVIIVEEDFDDGSFTFEVKVTPPPSGWKAEQ